MSCLHLPPRFGLFSAPPLAVTLAMRRRAGSTSPEARAERGAGYLARRRLQDCQLTSTALASDDATHYLPEQAKCQGVWDRRKNRDTMTSELLQAGPANKLHLQCHL